MVSLARDPHEAIRREDGRLPLPNISRFWRDSGPSVLLARNAIAASRTTDPVKRANKSASLWILGSEPNRAMHSSMAKRVDRRGLDKTTEKSKQVRNSKERWPVARPSYRPGRGRSQRYLERFVRHTHSSLRSAILPHPRRFGERLFSVRRVPISALVGPWGSQILSG